MKWFSRFFLFVHLLGQNQVMSRTMLIYFCVVVAFASVGAFSPHHGSSGKLFGLSKHHVKATKFMSPLQMVVVPEKQTEVEKRPGQCRIIHFTFLSALLDADTVTSITFL